ncbi:hypothetical protein [Rhodopirellula sp. P2]|uniref:hypothetical protein n=1 Tax=Rhodopirellula sp. P2 TaxID=2127060 RepID=UPI0023676FF2|nr:hypothetical protein [Rhodopirellula sp. P2]WDQ19342.1 hypothetical protein PSR62_12615 [Rhodopirellula sp. P2]
MTYELANADRRVKLSFYRLPAWKQSELTCCPVTAAMTTAFVFNYPGDRIAFVPDIGPSPFHDVATDDIDGFEDLTDAYIVKLVKDGILSDHGFIDDTEIDPPKHLRDIRTTWPSGAQRDE